PLDEPLISEPVVDKGAIMRRVNGDRKLLQEVVGIFMTDHQKLLERIRQAVQKGDGPELESAAHALKGSVQNFAAHRAVTAIAKLEDLGREGKMHSAEAALARVTADLEHLRP